MVFREQVGLRIRDLSLLQAKKIMKHLISTTLFEAGMNRYDNPISLPDIYSQPSK